MTGARADDTVRYEPHENPPPLIAAGAGLQAAMIIVAPVVLTVVIVARIAEQSESYLSWAVFAALLISGITTVLQAVRVGRVGAGHVLIMGTSGAFIRGLRRGARAGRPGHDGEPDHRVIAVPVRAGIAPLAAATDIYACCNRHGDNADSCHGDADSVRHIG